MKPMMRFFRGFFGVGLLLHGLVHAMGFAAYWPLAEVAELPYKTALWGGRLVLGAGGMRLFAAVWLAAALAFAVGTVLLALRRRAWAGVILAAALVSLVLCILDWEAAFRGAWINAAVLLVLGVVFGLRRSPAPLPPVPLTAGTVDTVPLPQGLPQTVERYLRGVYGERLPVIHSAVLTGRGTLRVMGVTFPARIRFSHRSGYDYRHYLEATFWGRPVMKVNEVYMNGRGRLELPFGVEEGSAVDSAANQGLWAEMMYYPASLVTDPRVRWESVDERRAKLHVPFGAETQTFTFEFDPASGDFVRLETLRLRDSKTPPMRWWCESPTVDGRKVFTATWEDEGTPWLTEWLEDAVYNADVSAYLLQKGA